MIEYDDQPWMDKKEDWKENSMNDWRIYEEYVPKEKFFQTLKNIGGDVFQESYDESYVTGYSLELIKELIDSLKGDDVVSISSRERELVEKGEKGLVLIVPNLLWFVDFNNKVGQVEFNNWLNKYVKVWKGKQYASSQSV